jgi:copper resistance protein B
MRARLLLAVAVLILPAPAFAQHSGHEGHAPETGATQEAEQDEHAGHVLPEAEEPPSQTSEADPHSAHRAAPADESAEHADHAAGPVVPGPPPEAFTGPEHAADAYFGETAMAQARGEMTAMHGAVPTHKVLIERMEARFHEGEEGYLVDAQAWVGGDLDKLWLKAEGEGVFEGDFEGLEIQALWSHAIGPWFDLQSGVRYDFNDGADRAHLALGVQGLAPYWIEVEATAFLSDKGDLTARIEAEHDARITQSLILQPRAEVRLSAQDVAEDLVGAGVSSASVGLRLRYAITPQFAPYIGVEYDTALGETRDRRRAANRDLGGVSILAGFRAWF